MRPQAEQGLLRPSMHLGVSPGFSFSICQISLNRTDRTCTCFTVHTVFSSPYLCLVTGSMDNNIFRIICRVFKRRKRGVFVHSETDGHRKSATVGIDSITDRWAGLDSSAHLRGALKGKVTVRLQELQRIELLEPISVKPSLEV